MNTTINKTFATRCLLAVAASLLAIGAASCGEDSSEEARIYLVDESPNFFKEAYIVSSPAGGSNNWGSDRINTYETISSHPTWKVYKLTPGSYDIRLIYDIDRWNPGSDGVYEDLDTNLRSGRGKKYEASSNGYLFGTTFSFDL